MFTCHSGRRVNGGCADYRGHSLNAKKLAVLECFVLVHNFRTEVVCHNQILQCLHRSTSESLTYNINGYDRIHRYYLEPGDYKPNYEAELLEENFGNKGENEDAGF